MNMNVPSSHLVRAQEKKAGKEHVLLPNFVRKFGFDKDSKIGLFLMLIGSNNLRQSLRVHLQQLFTEFQQYLEESFWSDHSLKISTSISTKQADATVQTSGSKQAQMEYQGFITHLGKDEGHKSDSDTDKSDSEADGNGPISGLCICLRLLSKFIS